MSNSFLFSKSKLYLTSLVVLASFACPLQSFAANGKEKGERVHKERVHKERPLKKPKTAHNSVVEKEEERTHTITLEFIDSLISDAKRGDEKAQDKLVALRYIDKYLTVEKIDFLNWKTQNSEKTIAERCYTNDEYAAFVLAKFTQEEIK